jgi:hypothetical protein
MYMKSMPVNKRPVLPDDSIGFTHVAGIKLVIFDKIQELISGKPRRLFTGMGYTCVQIARQRVPVTYIVNHSENVRLLTYIQTHVFYSSTYIPNFHSLVFVILSFWSA